MFGSFLIASLDKNCLKGLLKEGILERYDLRITNKVIKEQFEDYLNFCQEYGLMTGEKFS